MSTPSPGTDPVMLDDSEDQSGGSELANRLASMGPDTLDKMIAGLEAEPEFCSEAAKELLCFMRWRRDELREAGISG